MIRNRTVREALQFTVPSSTDFHSFHRPPKKEKRSKKERNGCYYYLSNSPLAPMGEYYKGMWRIAFRRLHAQRLSILPGEGRAAASPWSFHMNLARESLAG